MLRMVFEVEPGEEMLGGRHVSISLNKNVIYSMIVNSTNYWEAGNICITDFSEKLRKLLEQE